LLAYIAGGVEKKKKPGGGRTPWSRATGSFLACGKRWSSYRIKKEQSRTHSRRFRGVQEGEGEKTVSEKKEKKTESWKVLGTKIAERQEPLLFVKREKGWKSQMNKKGVG